MEFMLNFRDISIKIFYKSEKYGEKGYSDKESNKAEEMFRNEQYNKRDEDREVNIRWNNFWVEVIRFDRMYNSYHSKYSTNYNEAIMWIWSISITYNENWNSWEECSKHWYKSKYKHDEWESENIWKRFASMNETDTDESDRGQNSIHKCNDWLRLEYETESCTNFSRDYLPFIVEEWKISFFNFLKKDPNAISFYNENIREYKRHEEFCQKYSCIGNVSNSSLSNFFEISLIYDLCCEFV